MWVRVSFAHQCVGRAKGNAEYMRSTKKYLLNKRMGWDIGNWISKGKSGSLKMSVDFLTF